MNSDTVLAKLRQFLLIISAGIFTMTILELYFVGHWTVTIQFLPFILCAWGLVVLGIACLAPSRTTLNILRWSLVSIGAMSFIGFFEHLYNNYVFWLEIKPDASVIELVTHTLNGGIPILAPGILLLGAVIGLTAVYRHPLLEKIILDQK